MGLHYANTAPSKQHHLARFQVDASSSSGHPQLCTYKFEFNPSLLLLDLPAAPNLLQLPGDAHTEVSSQSVDDVLLNLHTWPHQTTDKDNNKDSEDALEEDSENALKEDSENTLEEDAAKATNLEGEVDLHEGIVLDWDLLAEEFIVEAEGLGKFEHSLLHIL